MLVRIIDSFKSVNNIAKIAFKSRLEVDCGMPRACIITDCELDDDSAETLFGLQTKQWSDVTAQDKQSLRPTRRVFSEVTLYNDKHLFHANNLKRYSLGTKNKNLKRNADGSLTLYAGAKSPGADKETNWLPAPDGNFSLYIRAYWGKEGILDGSWTPPVIKKVA